MGDRENAVIQLFDSQGNSGNEETVPVEVRKSEKRVALSDAVEVDQGDDESGRRTVCDSEDAADIAQDGDWRRGDTGEDWQRNRGVRDWVTVTNLPVDVQSYDANELFARETLQVYVFVRCGRW